MLKWEVKSVKVGPNFLVEPRLIVLFEACLVDLNSIPHLLEHAKFKVALLFILTWLFTCRFLRLFLVQSLILLIRWLLLLELSIVFIIEIWVQLANIVLTESLFLVQIVLRRVLVLQPVVISRLLSQLVRNAHNFHVNFAPLAVLVPDLHPDHLGCIILDLLCLKLRVQFLHNLSRFVLNKVRCDSLFLIVASLVHKFQERLHGVLDQGVLVCDLAEVLVQELQQN